MQEMLCAGFVLRKRTFLQNFSAFAAWFCMRFLTLNNKNAKN